MAGDFGNFSDARLAEMVAAGETDAFLELSSRFMGLVRAKAGQFTGPGAPEQEDLLQEGFLGLYAAALSYQPEAGASFATYAGVCVFNRMANAARRHGNPGNRTLNESLPLESAGDLSVQAGPQDIVEIKEGFRNMWRSIHETLTPLERRALALYLGGYRREEISERFGMALKTFDNALHRARVKLNEKGRFC